MTDYNWEKLKEVVITSRRSPSLSISKSGYARVNSSFREKYNLKDVKGVKMRYEEIDGKVVVAFMFLTDKEGFTVYEDERIKSLSFSVRSLMNTLGIDYRKMKTMKYSPKVQEANGKKIFIIEIKRQE